MTQCHRLDSAICGSGLLLAELVKLYEEIAAGDGQRDHQDDKLLEVHLAVIVLIKFLHDLVDRHVVFVVLE